MKPTAGLVLASVLAIGCQTVAPRLDLLPIYRDAAGRGQGIAVNALHPNAIGHEFAARSIIDALEAHGTLPRTRSSEVIRKTADEKGEYQPPNPQR